VCVRVVVCLHAVPCACLCVVCACVCVRVVVCLHAVPCACLCVVCVCVCACGAMSSCCTVCVSVCGLCVCVCVCVWWYVCMLYRVRVCVWSVRVCVCVWWYVCMLYCACEGVGEGVQRKRRSMPASNKTVYHRDGDRCAALDCLKPKSNKVSWVSRCSTRSSLLDVIYNICRKVRKV